MYTILMKIYVNSKEIFELINTKDPAKLFSEGKITRIGLSRFLAEDSFAHYSLEQLEDCEAVKVFKTESIKEFNA